MFEGMDFSKMGEMLQKAQEEAKKDGSGSCE